MKFGSNINFRVYFPGLLSCTDYSSVPWPLYGIAFDIRCKFKSKLLVLMCLGVMIMFFLCFNFQKNRK